MDPAHANADNIITLEGIWSVSGPTEYTIEGEIQISNTENTFLLSLNPPSRPIEFQDARLLVIASYSGGNHISIYSKIGLNDTGGATEKIVVSNTGLISLTAFLVDGLVYDGTSYSDYRWTSDQGS